MMNEDVLIEAMQFAKVFRENPCVKSIKVSQEFWELIKSQTKDLQDELPSVVNGYIGHFTGIPIIIDEDVDTWEVEYVNIDEYVNNFIIKENKNNE